MFVVFVILVILVCVLRGRRSAAGRRKHGV